MSLDVALLRSSFELVVEREPQVTTRFYEILFDRYPQVESMFHRNDPAVQQKMLAEALAAVIDHLDDPAWLRTTLNNLGAKHVQYNVLDEMYNWVGECLLAALAEIASEDWNDDLAQAWTDAYGAIVELMLDGAADERAAGQTRNAR